MARCLRALLVSGFALFADFVLGGGLNGDGAAAGDLTAELRRLLAAPDYSVITALVDEHRPAIMADPALAVPAVIALRAAGKPRVAAALARDAQSRQPYLHPGLLYEEAFSLWLAQDCQSAMPLFMEVHEAANAALRREAAAMLATCARALGGWHKSVNAVLGYGDDLAATGARKTITPEPGSRLDTLITSLADAFPDANIPGTITIGEATVSGVWFGARGRLERTVHDDGIRSGAHLTGEARAANRRGFGQLAFRMRGQRETVVGKIRPVTALGLDGKYVLRGPGRKALRQIAIDLDQSWRVVWPRNFIGLAGVKSRISRTRTTARSDVVRSGLYLGLIHLHGDNGLGWQGEVFAGNQTGGRYHTAAIRRMTVSVAPLDLGDGARLHIGHSLEVLDYAHPRPWLRAPHDEVRRNWHLALTYPFGQGKTLGVNLNLLDRDSPDALDNGRKLALDMEFYF